MILLNMMSPRGGYHQDIRSCEESQSLSEAHVLLLPLLEIHHRLSVSVSLIDAVNAHLKNKTIEEVLSSCTILNLQGEMRIALLVY